ncbi:hypothetical protein DVH24_028858 [Malus domestica]|uniref:Uncharacterized protein n=1 Tax=Malus domestica TaxID=3750 RepID=A0A498KR01_MALDO|nr:hypothetical protein DVH24_009275 [Malus domestica]RXI09541.1 hypothetical protein DVH24_028858 [Malus domestica]
MENSIGSFSYVITQVVIIEECICSFDFKKEVFSSTIPLSKHRWKNYDTKEWKLEYKINNATVKCELIKVIWLYESCKIVSSQAVHNYKHL